MMTGTQPDYTARLQAAAQAAAEEIEEIEEIYAQHDMCFVEACEDLSPNNLPSMCRGIGWLWWG